MTHKIKIQREYADRIIGEVKKFEVRKNDRDYQVKDILVFQAIDNSRSSFPLELDHPINDKAYLIKYVHSGLGMKEDYVVLGIEEIKIETEMGVNEWIDVKKKKPKNTRNVIATTSNGYVGEMYYNPEKKEWYCDGAEVFEGVIGWKEKPKPYKREE